MIGVRSVSRVVKLVIPMTPVVKICDTGACERHVDKATSIRCSEPDKTNERVRRERGPALTLHVVVLRRLRMADLHKHRASNCCIEDVEERTDTARQTQIHTTKVQIGQLVVLA